MPDMSETVETLPILLVPEPILKTRARPVGANDMQRVRALVPRMFATMYRAPGIGLAAPQVGVGLRFADVTRPARVTVRHTDADGVRRQIEADGLLAACLQHEIDHLDGVLFVDHLSALKRNMILRRLAKELRQKRAEAM